MAIKKDGTKQKTKRVILIVDDQPQNIELLEAYLVPQGYTIIKAANGEEALGKLSGNQIDLILLDVIMPGIDGFEVTRRIRQDNVPRKVPIILVTSLKEPEDRVKGMEAGCDDFISKPVDKVELLARVRSLLKVKDYNDLISNYQKEYESEVTVRIGELEYTLENLQSEIAGRKQAEEEIKSSEVKYRELYKSIPVPTYTWRQEGDDFVLTDYNNAASLFTKGAIEKIVGIRLSEMYKDYPQILDDFKKCLQEKTVIEREMEYQFQFSTARKFLRVKYAYVPPDFVLIHTEDYTERKKTEEALEKSENQYRETFDNAPIGIFHSTEDGKFTFVNPSLARMLGFGTPDELIAFVNKTNIAQALYVNHSRRTEIINEIRNKEGWSYFENDYRRKDGSILTGEISIYVVKQPDGTIDHIMGIVKDITEHKQMEEERQKLAKLESIGTLAGGIAHDFNNLLTGILGNIQLASGYLKQNKSDTAEEMLAEAENASLRAKDLTQQLLTFSKGGAPVKKVLFINQLIKKSVTFALRGSRVKPEFAIADNLWAVEGDEGQLNQVINNLVINADQAMSNNGTLNVSARNIVINKQNALSLPDCEYVEIAIKDQGVGIPERSKARIFEPYFTTKQTGSGLGLATSFSIIKNHGGHMTFESQLGVGTTFHIYLPATKEKIEKVQEQISTQPIPKAQGRILVMDDESVIRMLLGRILKGAGYEVELTEDGAKAIQKFFEAKESGKLFDAVILDLTVPGGMGGEDVIGKLLEIDPGVKAIVSSGYANDPIMAGFKDYGFSGVVTKPYSIKELTETLRKLLTEKG